MTVFIEKYFQPNSIFQNLFIPSALVLFYSGFLAIISHFIFPFTKNVNYYFSLGLIACSLLVLLLASLALVILWRKNSRLVFASPPRMRGITNVLWIALLPLEPTIRYLLANQNILSLRDVIVTLAVCLSLSLILVAAIPMLLSKRSPVRLLVSTASAFVFTIMNMASISNLLHWHVQGSILIQLLLFALALVVTWLLLGLRNKEVAFVVVALLASSIVTQIPSQSTSSSIQNPLDAYRENNVAKLGQPTHTPNIYLLVYDAYVPNETMLNYGIDNSVQESFLIEQDFTLYPNTYSVGSSSVLSMNGVLNVASIDSYSRMGVDGSGMVSELFRSLGYRGVGIFPSGYFFRNSIPQYDDYTPKSTMPSSQLLLLGAGMGQFRFDLGQTIDHEAYIRAKREVFVAPSETPLFVYTHSDHPNHSQNSGACLPNETELFVERLHEANEEMRQDIATITINDPDAIVIVAGDHGPYLTKNCYSLGNIYDTEEITRIDIQDRYGTFLAARWPVGEQGYDQITVLQDIFPAIFAWMYRDPALLEIKVEPVTIPSIANGEVGVRDGIIFGGKDDNQPLFLSGE
jgi:hypothetical protein